MYFDHSVFFTNVVALLERILAFSTSSSKAFLSTGKSWETKTSFITSHGNQNESNNLKDSAPLIGHFLISFSSSLSPFEIVCWNCWHSFASVSTTKSAFPAIPS